MPNRHVQCLYVYTNIRNMYVYTGAYRQLNRVVGETERGGANVTKNKQNFPKGGAKDRGPPSVRLCVYILI